MDSYESEEDAYVPKKRNGYMLPPSNGTMDCIALTQGSSDGRSTTISQNQVEV